MEARMRELLINHATRKLTDHDLMRMLYEVAAQILPGAAEPTIYLYRDLYEQTTLCDSIGDGSPFGLMFEVMPPETFIRFRGIPLQPYDSPKLLDGECPLQVRLLQIDERGMPRLWVGGSICAVCEHRRDTDARTTGHLS